jgi:hypothetical protein
MTPEELYAPARRNREPISTTRILLAVLLLAGLSMLVGMVRAENAGRVGVSELDKRLGQNLSGGR